MRKYQFSSVVILLMSMETCMKKISARQEAAFDTSGYFTSFTTFTEPLCNSENESQKYGVEMKIQ